MKLTLDRAALLKATAAARRLIRRNSPIPILSGVLIEAENSWVRITGTDMDAWLALTVPAEVSQAGSTVIEAERLHQAIQAAASDQVTLSVRPDGVHGLAGKMRFRLRSMKPEEFPTQAAWDAEPSLVLPREQFLGALEYAASAVDPNHRFANLAGVHLRAPADTLRVEGTDNRRMARTEIGLPRQGVRAFRDANGQPRGITIPGYAIEKIVALFDEGDTLTVQFGERGLRLIGEGVEFTTRLILDQFPDIERIVPPSPPAQAELDRKELIALVRRVAMFGVDEKTNARARGFTMRFTSGRVTAIAGADHADVVTDEMAADYTDGEREVGIEAGQFLALLKAASDDRVVLGFGDSLPLVKITFPNQPETLAVLACFAVRTAALPEAA